MGDKHEKKAYYKRRDGRPEMKYQGIMGVTLFLMVLLTGICLVESATINWTDFLRAYTINPYEERNFNYVREKTT